MKKLFLGVILILSGSCIIFSVGAYAHGNYPTYSSPVRYSNYSGNTYGSYSTINSGTRNGNHPAFGQVPTIQSAQTTPAFGSTSTTYSRTDSGTNTYGPSYLYSPSAPAFGSTPTVPVKNNTAQNGIRTGGGKYYPPQNPTYSRNTSHPNSAAPGSAHPAAYSRFSPASPAYQTVPKMVPATYSASIPGNEGASCSSCSGESRAPGITTSACGGFGCGEPACGESVCEMEQGGLFTPHLNYSPAAQFGSRFLGPGSFFVDGYLAQGLTFGTGRESFPQVTNDRGNGFQLNQVYLSFGRSIKQEGCWAIGGRVDVMFGTDYYYMQSRGLETTRWNMPRWNGTGNKMTYSRGYADEYGAALPQAYLEVYSPWLQGISVKMGHFYSPMGYESMMSTNNFFYSHSYTSIYGLPTTMTGVLTTTRISPRMNLILGAVNGWNGTETVNNDFSFIGGLTLDTYDQRFSIAALIMTGKQDMGLYGWNRHATNQPEMDSPWVTVFNLQAKWQIISCMTYAVDFVAGNGERTLYQGRYPTDETISWFGLSNYLFFQLNEYWAVGTRFEWFNDPQDTMVVGTDTGETVNYFAWTVGAKWTPLSWLTVRPELRWDYSDYKQTWGGQTVRAFDNGKDRSQFTVAADMIIRF
ncbi:MAG: outer membrane beta-barrel protein [Planctomycetia bacterium]|nr:outer membrane beta-barrel protein [Planctomycetia bacterium]